MTLGEYLEQNALTLAAFAARIGRSAATVNRLIRGLNRPEWKTIRAIEKATAGTRPRAGAGS